MIAYFKILRPLQWVKNMMIFFPPLLGGAILLADYSLTSGLLSFVAFCCTSSALYVFNDINDIDRDILHPLKRSRPLASGIISKQHAIFLACLLFALGLILAFLLVSGLIVFLLLYAAVSIIYSLWLKNIPVVDLFCISFGFVIRLMAGGTIFRIEISPWLFLSVFLLSLFLSAGKRLSEKKQLGTGAQEHRSCLRDYPEGSLDLMLVISASASLCTYTMYTLDHMKLLYSVPLCTFGLFRYILRVKSGNSGDPTESLFHDIPLLSVSVIWFFVVVWSIYR